MIISHRHKFIFIKTRKTAGTSIEISLSRYCGPDDILTPITLSDEPLRGVFGMAAQNYLCPSDGTDRSILRQPVRRACLKMVSHIELKRPGSFPDRVRRRLSNHRGARGLHMGHFYNHMSSAEVIGLIGHDVWNRYYRFCFEREPIAKVVSDYRYRAGDRSFDEYLRDFPLPVDFDKYYVNGVQSVDLVGRFESLAQDLSAALCEVGIAFDGWLPRAKAGGQHRGVVDLSPSQRSAIEDRFRREHASSASREQSSGLTPRDH